MSAVGPWLKSLTMKLKSEKSELTFCSFWRSELCDLRQVCSLSDRHFILSCTIASLTLNTHS